MKRALHFVTPLNIFVLGTLLWSVRLCLQSTQSSISRASGDLRSHIEEARGRLCEK